MNATTMNDQSPAELFARASDETLQQVIERMHADAKFPAGDTEAARRLVIQWAQTEVARRKARQLVEVLGADHPRAFAAMLEYVELADPGATRRALKESGINLPAPTHVVGNGTPFYASEAIADALDLPHDQVQEEIEQMCELAPEFGPADGELHRIQ